MTTPDGGYDKKQQTEQSIKNMTDLIEDREKFNYIIENLYRSIPFEAEFSKRALMIYISDAIDASNQIEIDELETEEFVDCYLKESAPQVPQESHCTSGNSTPRFYTPGFYTPGCPDEPQTDDQIAFSLEEMGLFMIFLLKSRITILETIQDQYKNPQSQKDDDASFCTALGYYQETTPGGEDVVSVVSSSKSSTISDVDEEFKKKMAYYQLVYNNYNSFGIEPLQD